MYLHTVQPATPVASGPVLLTTGATPQVAMNICFLQCPTTLRATHLLAEHYFVNEQPVLFVTSKIWYGRHTEHLLIT